jgi:hypothetical protein
MSIYYQKNIVVKKLRTEFKEGQPQGIAPTIGQPQGIAPTIGQPQGIAPTISTYRYTYFDYMKCYEHFTNSKQ